jgi:TrmH family RNA methyltransferase
MINSKNISSSDNSYFKFLKSLTESKGLKKESSFLVSGEKLLTEFIKKNSANIEAIILNEKIHDIDTTNPDREFDKVLAALLKGEYPQISVYRLTPELFKQLDTLGTHQPLLLAKQKPILEWHPEENFIGLEVLCPLSDPQNLGALARSAWALGADRLILLKEAAHPFLPKTWKASAGSIWDIPLYSGPSLQELKDYGTNNISNRIITLDMSGENLWTFDWPRNSRLLLGEEGQGIPNNLSSIKVSIPMRKPVESLNVAVAGALAINQYFLKLKIK